LPEQALYLKWRPFAFEDVIGQEHITRTLRNSIKSGRIRHAYLFSGPRGTGKTTTARLLAKAVNCVHEDLDRRPCNECALCFSFNAGRFLDLIEIDAASYTGVDNVRDLREKIAFTPGEGRYKVYIIDEVHRFSGSAFDALLKTLEEPPDHAIFVLATTEIDKVPSTIKSRCLQFEFRRVSMLEVADRLQMIAEAEGLSIERSALELIARQGTGSVRDSISLLDQIVSDPEETITLDIAERILGTANTVAVNELIEAMIAEDIPRGMHIINAAIDSGSDPRQFGQQTVEHLRSIMLAQTASADLVEASDETRKFLERQANQISRNMLLKALRSFNEAVNDYKGGWQPQLTLELAFIESVRQAEPEVVQIIQQASAQSSGSIETAAFEDMPPGSPPVVPASAIQEHWKEFLKALYHYSSSGPAVLEQFRVQKVEGNLVYLCTDTNVFYDRLYGQREKLNAIERALYDVHGVGLRAKVLLVDDISNMGGDASSSQEIDDPVISMGIELGGQLKSDDDGDN
jgi:DNA polymerase-3 subunit gamma/tau